MPPSKRYITILKLSKKSYHFFITHSSLFLHYNLPLLNYSIEIKLHKLAQPLLMYTVSVQQSLWSPHSSLLCHSASPSLYPRSISTRPVRFLLLRLDPSVSCVIRGGWSVYQRLAGFIHGHGAFPRLVYARETWLFGLMPAWYRS